MSEKTITIRPKFDVVKPGVSVLPPPEIQEASTSQIRAELGTKIVNDLSILGIEMKEKCHTCKGLPKCALLIALDMLGG